MKHFLLGVLVTVLLAVAVSYAGNRYFFVQAPLDTSQFADCSDAELVEGKVEKVGKTQFNVLLAFQCKEVKI